jgi:hypothetical protein
MFSMKYVDGNGVEWLEGGFIRTRASRHPETQRLSVEGDRPDGARHIFFQDDEPYPGNTTCPRLYVMNENGTTVAHYYMGHMREGPVQSGYDLDGTA